MVERCAPEGQAHECRLIGPGLVLAGNGFVCRHNRWTLAEGSRGHVGHGSSDRRNQYHLQHDQGGSHYLSHRGDIYVTQEHRREHQAVERAQARQRRYDDHVGQVEEHGDADDAQGDGAAGEEEVTQLAAAEGEADLLGKTDSGATGVAPQHISDTGTGGHPGARVISSRETCPHGRDRQGTCGLSERSSLSWID